jgi:hypothetical protein
VAELRTAGEIAQALATRAGVEAMLASMPNEPRGVTQEQSIIDKNIIKPETPVESNTTEVPDVKPTPTQPEKTRWRNIAEIIGKTLGVGKFEEGPEAKRNIVPPAVQAVSDKTGDMGKDNTFSDLSKRNDLLALLLPLFILSTEIFETLTPIMRFASKTVFKMSSWLKIFNSIFKFFTTTKLGNILVPIKPIVSFFTNMGTNLVNWFKNLIPGLGASTGVGSTAAKGGGNFLTKILTGVGSKILKILKFVPVVGGIIGLGFAWSRFKAGDYGAATLELISAILSLIPFPPLWIASALIDGMLLLYDLQTAKDKEVNPNVPKKGLFATLASGFKNYIVPLLRYIPLIGSIMYFGDAMGNFTSGNWVAGFKDLGRGMIALVGGKGLVDGFEFVLSLFNTEKTTPAEPKAGKSFFSIVMEKVSGVVGEVLTNVKNWGLEQATKLVDWFKGSGSANDIPLDKLTPQQQANLKNSGWSTWEEYKSADWKSRATVERERGSDIQVTPSSVSDASLTTKLPEKTEMVLSSPDIATDKSEEEISKLNGTFTQYHKNFKHAATLEITLLEEIRDSINKLTAVTGTLTTGTGGSSSTRRGILSNKTDGAVNFRNEMNTFTTPILT